MLFHNNVKQTVQDILSLVPWRQDPLLVLLCDSYNYIMDDINDLDLP